MLSICYASDRRRITVSCPTPEHPSWKDLRRTLLGYFPEMSDGSSAIITVPTQVFAMAHESIFAANDDMGHSELEVDEGLMSQLRRTIAYREDFEHPEEYARDLGREQIRSKLEKAGWRLNDLEPSDFQYRNLSNMCSKATSAASFSVPGAGKTVEGLAYFGFHGEGAGRMLVVLPRVGYTAWEEELEKCYGMEVGEDVIRIDGDVTKNAKIVKEKPDARVYLITYDKFWRNEDLIFNLLDSDDEWTMVLDESHRIMNDSKRSQSVRRIAPFVRRRLILTGTPVPNSIENVARQFEFLYPELDYDIEDAVESMRAIFVCTTKKDLDLKDIDEVSLRVEMLPEQERIYNLLRRSEEARSSEFPNEPITKIRLRKLGWSSMILIMCASNPMLLQGKTEIPKEIRESLSRALEESEVGLPPKLAKACEKARELVKQGKKVLIWSSFVGNVKAITNALADLGADYILGETPSDTMGKGSREEPDEGSREEIIQRFKTDPEMMVLVANPAAAGESISLHHECHDAIYVDRTYNAGNFIQSRDRIHRYGEKEGVMTCKEKTVTYYYISTDDTIDDAVNISLDRKIGRMREFLNSSDRMLEPMDIPPATEFGFEEEDLQDLIDHLEEENGD